jgi:hypothetical protein
MKILCILLTITILSGSVVSNPLKIYNFRLLDGENLLCAESRDSTLLEKYHKLEITLSEDNHCKNSLSKYHTQEFILEGNTLKLPRLTFRTVEVPQQNTADELEYVTIGFGKMGNLKMLFGFKITDQLYPFKERINSGIADIEKLRQLEDGKHYLNKVSITILPDGQPEEVKIAFPELNFINGVMVYREQSSTEGDEETSTEFAYKIPIDSIQKASFIDTEDEAYALLNVKTGSEDEKIYKIEFESAGIWMGDYDEALVDGLNEILLKRSNQPAVQEQQDASGADTIRQLAEPDELS